MFQWKEQGGTAKPVDCRNHISSLLAHSFETANHVFASLLGLYKHDLSRNSDECNQTAAGNRTPKKT